jgi:hypothetical protein
MAGPPNKITNYLPLPSGNPNANIAALNTAWAAYFATYGVYPSVWVSDNGGVYYGGY